MKNSFIAVLAFVFFPALIRAQSGTDLQFWSQVGYEVHLSKDWSLGLSTSYRAATYDFSLDRAIVEAQLTQRPSKQWKRSIEVRNYTLFTPRTEEPGWDQRLRLRYNVERSFKVSHGTAAVRGGIQHRMPLVGGGNHRTTARLKTSYEYRIKDFSWDPELQLEYLHDLNNNFERNLRVGLESGKKFALGKGSLGYFYERNLSFTDPHRHVVQWTFTFK